MPHVRIYLLCAKKYDRISACVILLLLQEVNTNISLCVCVCV